MWDVFFSCSPAYVSEQGLSLNLDLTNLTRWLVRMPQETFFSSAPKHCYYKSMLTHLFSLIHMLGLNSGAIVCATDNLPVEQSL